MFEEKGLKIKAFKLTGKYLVININNNNHPIL